MSGVSTARPLSIRLIIVRAVSVLYSMVVSLMPGTLITNVTGPTKKALFVVFPAIV
jgi:hypothetical protein